jgi:uncharacterized membrane protein YhfC
MLRTSRAIILLIGIVCGTTILFSAPLLDVQQTEPSQTDTSVYTFTFTLARNQDRLIMNVDSDLQRGSLNIWIGGGGYQVIGNYTNEGTFTYNDLIFGPLNNREPVQVKITARHALGDWHIVFTEFSREKGMIGFLISGNIVLVISVIAIVWWKRRYHHPMKWLWLGGGIWAVGVVLKFLFASLANAPALGWITDLFGQTGYRMIGSFYIGSLTGVFEIGGTLLFAVFIKKMYAHASRAIGIGLGAGTVEALLIAFSQIGSMVFLMIGTQGSTDVIGSLVRTMNLNLLFFMLAPVERAIAILCHTSSRVLTLYAVMRRKYVYFWAGFLIMSGIDAIAGYVHLAGLLDRISMWWIELALLPFALVSIPIIQWCSHRWQQKSEEPYGKSDIVK